MRLSGGRELAEIESELAEGRAGVGGHRSNLVIRNVARTAIEKRSFLQRSKTVLKNGELSLNRAVSVLTDFNLRLLLEQTLLRSAFDLDDLVHKRAPIETRS